MLYIFTLATQLIVPAQYDPTACLANNASVVIQYMNMINALGQAVSQGIINSDSNRMCTAEAQKIQLMYNEKKLFTTCQQYAAAQIVDNAIYEDTNLFHHLKCEGNN
jgi:hypothetical protein